MKKGEIQVRFAMDDILPVRKTRAPIRIYKIRDLAKD